MLQLYDVRVALGHVELQLAQPNMKGRRPHRQVWLNI